MRTKKSYHTDFILQYKLNLLPQAVQKNVPVSTRHNWNKRDMTQLFGYDAAMASEENMAMIKDFLCKKRLLYAGKAVYHIYNTFSSLLNQVKQKNNNNLRK